MRGPFANFQSLNIGACSLANVTLPDRSAIDREMESAFERHGLLKQDQQALGAFFVIPSDDGKTQRQLARNYLYTLATPDEVLAGVRAHIAAIADRFGAGRVWFLAAPVHVVTDDGMVAVSAESGGTQHLLLRTFYIHEKQENAR